MVWPRAGAGERGRTEACDTKRVNIGTGTRMDHEDAERPSGRDFCADDRCPGRNDEVVAALRSLAMSAFGALEPGVGWDQCDCS